MNRQCDECKETYSRCNKISVYVRQNPGHRWGWIKVTKSICCKCMPQSRVRAMTMRVKAYFGPPKTLLPTRPMLKLALKKAKDQGVKQAILIDYRKNTPIYINGAS